MIEQQQRYGYLDMPPGFSDISTHLVRAVCPNCGRWHYVLAEEAGGCPTNEDIPLVDDLCSEYDGVEYIDNRQHEW
jgi:hypothetical protein